MGTISRVAAVCAVLLTGGCDLPASNDTASAEPPATAAPPTFADLPGLDNYTMVFDRASPLAEVEAAAREKCSGKSLCMVMGWTDKAFAPTAMPMTDREMDAQAFHLNINRSSGNDSASWDCARFPQAPKETCLSKG